MNQQVMIYEIKSSANKNWKPLFHPQGKYFYWNQRKFKNLEIGDYVFVVNKHSGHVLFTKVDDKNIRVSYDASNNKSSFEDKNNKFIVDGKWDDFVRLEIRVEIDGIANDWDWKSLGSSEIAYLNGRKVNPDTAANRRKNIEQLKELSSDKEYLAILDNCEKNFPKDYSTIVSEKTVKKKENMDNYDYVLTAIQTKPFIILAGISGTGKSRLVRELAFKTCDDYRLRNDINKPGNFELVSVKPNWHDSSELLGYISRINGEKYIATPFLKFIIKAWTFPETPFFLCLDEMNLAPVEQYFAEYLSIIETRSSKEDTVITDAILAKETIGKDNFEKLLNEIGIKEDNDTATLYSRFIENGIQIPNNLVVMGTVNMDETTYSFSRKVLDRAMTIEMNDIDLSSGLDVENNDLKYPSKYITFESIIGNKTFGAEVFKEFNKSKDVLIYLESLNEMLDGSPFRIAYRVRDEFLIYCYYNHRKGVDFNQALDILTSMKVLSRIEGDEAKVGQVLKELHRFFEEKEFRTSLSKVQEMQKKLEFGYTSFWS